MTTFDIRSVPRECLVTVPVAVAYTPGVRKLCRATYEGHPKGCPNFGKREDCPPRAPLFLKRFLPEVRIVAVRFDIGTYLRCKREGHPDWTDRALRNPRHWQGHVRAELRRFIRDGCRGSRHSEDVVVNTPEAMGVDLTATCARVGITLEWPPQRNAHEIALLCRPFGGTPLAIAV